MCGGFFSATLSVMVAETTPQLKMARMNHGQNWRYQGVLSRCSMLDRRLVVWSFGRFPVSGFRSSVVGRRSSVVGRRSSENSGGHATGSTATDKFNSALALDFPETGNPNPETDGFEESIIVLPAARRTGFRIESALLRFVRWTRKFRLRACRDRGRCAVRQASSVDC